MAEFKNIVTEDSGKNASSPSGLAQPESAVVEQSVVLDMESCDKAEFVGTIKMENVEVSTTNILQEDAKNPNISGVDCQEGVQTNVAEQPVLLQFFTEDRCGNDVDGKAFFEQISTEKIVLNNGLSTAGKIFPEQRSSAEPLNSSFLQSEEPLAIEISSAWIQSPERRNILVKLTTSPPGTFSLDKSMITTPSIIIGEELEDPLKVILAEVSPTTVQQRKVLTANDVSQDEQGLKSLIEAECFHAAVNLTARLLRSYANSQSGVISPSPQTLQLWFIRMALFVKLKKFSCAEVECEAFGDLDNPDLYYDCYTNMYLVKKGCMVPFSLRLLLAELPQYLENYQLALNRLCRMQYIILKILSNLQSGLAEDGSAIKLSETRQEVSLALWHSRECRVLYSILNCFLSQRDYVMAISITEKLLEKDPVHFVELYSTLGRIYLQLGDMKEAQTCFGCAAKHSETPDDSSNEYEHLINKALLAISLNDNEEAYKCYHKALTIRPNNPMLINNLSVCLLYMGRLKDSLTLLEQAIQKNPSAFLHDSIMFNICTLYELESSHCTLKKHNMLKLVSKYAGDSFSVSSLKIPVNSKG